MRSLHKHEKLVRILAALVGRVNIVSSNSRQMAGKDFSSFADNDSSEESTIGGSKGSKGSDKTKSTSGNTIQDKNYKAEDSKSSENSKDTNAEATSLVKKMQQREEKNKETLNKLRQLNDKVFKRKITVKAVLKVSYTY